MFKFAFSIIFIGLGISWFIKYSIKTNQKPYYSSFLHKEKVKRSVSSKPHPYINYFKDLFFEDDSFRFLKNKIVLRFKTNNKTNILLTKKLNQLFESYFLKKIEDRDFKDFTPDSNFLSLFFNDLPPEFREGKIQFQFHKSYNYNITLGSNILQPYQKEKLSQDGFKYLLTSDIPDAADTYQYLGGSLTFSPKDKTFVIKRIFKINEFSQYNAFLKSEDMNLDFLYFKEKEKGSNHFMTTELIFTHNEPQSYEVYFGLKDQLDQYHEPNGEFFLRGVYLKKLVLIKVRGLFYDFKTNIFKDNSFLNIASKNKPEGLIEYTFKNHQQDLITAFDLKKVGPDDF
ncbi:MAG: hypothetical protein ACO20H_06265 [Bacteriovoracaceae bacterium]